MSMVDEDNSIQEVYCYTLFSGKNKGANIGN